MIRVIRGPEPSGLAAIRSAGVEVVRALGRDPTRKELPDGYRSVADELWAGHRYKCCYCEHQEQRKRNDVEHFRPACRARRAPGSPDTHGYWWLAWTWDNLLFSCRNCNQAGAKHDRFPLAPGSRALVPTEAPPGEESPLLLDPADPYVDPRDHIVFQPVRFGSAVRWRPFARDGSSRGAATIDVCKLDRDDLVEMYTRHVDEVVKPELDALLAVTEAGSFERAWGEYRRRVLSTQMSFTALACDATVHLGGARLEHVRVEPHEPT